MRDLTRASLAHCCHRAPCTVPVLYFNRATADHPLQEREHALDFGDEHALPNVFIAINDKELVPGSIRQGLRAVSWDDPLRQRADYRPKDIVIWA